MTISVQTTTNTYTANGLTTAFPFTFRCDDADHLRVYKNGVLITSGITYSGLGNNAGGTVTFTTAPADGDTIFMFRNVSLERTTDYTEGAAIPSGTLDNDVDAVWMALQDRQARSFDFDGEGNLDVGGLRIVNVADPVNAQDVATKTWSETSVSSQVGIATTKANEASGYATAAMGYRDTASTHATTATNKASEASGYATAAMGYRDTASTHATTATNKASEASGYATAAMGYRDTASTHATTATNKASEASGYADAALLSATNAAASYDAFDDRYLGSKATDPSLDNDGNALQAGALYLNTTSSVFKGYTGSSWISLPSTSAGSVTFSATGNITSTNVQSAIAEVDTEKVAKAGDTMTGNLTIQNGTDEKALTLGSSGAYLYGNATTYGLYKSGAGQLTWTASTGDLITTGDVQAYSDVRLKKDFTTIDKPLDKVKSLNGLTFTRTDIDKRQVGLIAQEVLEVMPEAVNQDGEYLAVSYGNLVGLLVEAIKELSKQVDDLKVKQ